MSTSTWAKPAVKASVSGVDIPKGRASHSINVIKDNLYVFSGEHEPRVPIDARLHVFNLPSQQWTPAIQPSSATPSPRVGHGSVTFNDTIYIFGGRVGAEMNPLNDMYEFEPANGHWAKVEQSGDIPQARSYFSMAASEKYIYIFGGCPTSGRLNDLHRFNPSTKIWESLPASSSLSPRGGAGLAYLNGKIYVHGGFNGKELSDIWSFDEGTKVWEELEVVGEKPEGRSVHGFVSLKERGVLVCLYGERDPSPTGHVGAGKYFDDVWIMKRKGGNKVSWELLTPSSEEGKPTPRGWIPVATWGKDNVVLCGGFNGDSRDNDVFLLHLA